jgi:hypothetical protein
MAGSIPTFDPWFPPRGGNAYPFALSPLQERVVRAVASLLEELRPPQVDPSETLLLGGPQVARLVPWEGSTEDDRHPDIVIFIPHRALGGLGLYIDVMVHDRTPCRLGWCHCEYAWGELWMTTHVEAALPPVTDEHRTIEPILNWTRSQLVRKITLERQSGGNGRIDFLTCSPDPESSSNPWETVIQAPDLVLEGVGGILAHLWQRLTRSPPPPDVERVEVTFMDAEGPRWPVPPRVELWEWAWGPRQPPAELSGPQFP